MDNSKVIIGISASAIISLILFVVFFITDASAPAMVPTDRPKNEIFLIDLTVKNTSKIINELESIDREITKTAKFDPESLLGKTFTFYIASDLPSSDPAFQIQFPLTLGRKKANLFAGYMEYRRTISKIIKLLNNKKKYNNSFIIEPLVSAMKEKNVNTITVLSDLCIVDKIRNFESGKWLTPEDLTIYPNREKIKFIKISTDIPYPHDRLLTAWWEEALWGKSKEKEGFWQIFFEIKKEIKERLNSEELEFKKLEDEVALDEEEISEMEEKEGPADEKEESLPNKESNHTESELPVDTI